MPISSIVHRIKPLINSKEFGALAELTPSVRPAHKDVVVKATLCNHTMNSIKISLWLRLDHNAKAVVNATVQHQEEIDTDHNTFLIIMLSEVSSIDPTTRMYRALLEASLPPPGICSPSRIYVFTN